jgi:phage host-nuclease inhibitor protein Gam
MTAIRLPRSTAGAIGLLELFAHHDAEIAAVEAQRSASLARINAEADAEIAPLLEKREAVRGVLAQWWPSAEAELTEGKRKSILLGGCKVGKAKGRDRLAIAGDEDDVLTLLKTLRWAKPLVQIKYSLDRVAALKALDGKHAAALGELGLSREGGEDVFFVKRVEQPGTLAG